ncbi:RNA recognition motif domain-containing protein [Glaciecola sp. SC05]|uniref:RNA recognition motif domain-containing protein n=1 Tax=Glaciecola sp. SC05 TaxID=1987355 RepID=UPI0035276583
MISIRLPLALIITVILSVAAYFIDQAFLQSSFSSFIPSIFVVITVLLLSIPTLLSTSASSNTSAPIANVTPAPRRPVNTDASITTLYVGNLPYKANEISIKSLFEEIGTVTSVRLMKDRKTGRRKGFGFVEVEASKQDIYIEKLNDSEYMDRTIKVRPAKDKTE